MPTDMTQCMANKNKRTLFQTVRVMVWYYLIREMCVLNVQNSINSL
jgi:hypothetical protein